MAKEKQIKNDKKFISDRDPDQPAETFDNTINANDLADIEIPITPDMIDKFIHEAEEKLEQFEQTWLRLETERDEANISLALRDIHSFKGNCGFMGLTDLAKVSHGLETLLEGLKEQSVVYTAELSTLVLHMTDLLRKHVLGLNNNPKGVVAGLDRYLTLLEQMNASRKGTGSEGSSGGLEALQKELDDHTQPHMIHQWTSQAIARQDLRVDLNNLDALINLVGELVIAQAMLIRHPAILTMRDEGVERAVHQLQRISQDLQDVAMAVRMVPLSATFRKMIRLVHDLSLKAGKQVDFQMTGEETEVDKSVIEKIADPLVHLVRNAIDHGLETPAEREAKGKPAAGKLTIDARHESGEVRIAISDDGRGMDRKKIFAKAVAQGLTAKDAVLSDKQIDQFVFEAGFSTADIVSEVSGRGVGLDVVKKNIEKLKGRVDIHTRPDQGTTFILRLPLTLAVIDGMLVKLGTARYTIPLLAIRESFRPLGSQITRMPNGGEIVRVRDEVMPVLRLQDVFHQPADAQDLTQGILIVVEAEGQVVSLFADEILGQQETVIKAVPGYLGRARGISGCSILGDGEVSLILDIRELIDMSESIHSPGKEDGIHDKK